MIDPVLASLIERVTRLEAANDVNLPQLLQRLQQLEERLTTIAEQARIDREQAERREIAALRQRADAAEAEAARLRDERVVGANRGMTNGPERG